MINLPNNQSITIETDPENMNLEDLALQTTMLLDYFALNERDHVARQHKYVDIPKFYTFKSEKINGNKLSFWSKRKASFNCLGRIYAVSPANVELFHLRLILNNVNGATSFENLKTINGQSNETFIGACLALGLIEDDKE